MAGPFILNDQQRADVHAILRDAARFFRQLENRLENELRGIHDPSDRADARENLEDLRAVMARLNPENVK